MKLSRLNSHFALTAMAMAASSLARTNLEPMPRGICMISDGNDDTGGGDPAPGADTAVKTDVADAAAGGTPPEGGAEGGENTGGGTPEGGAVAEEAVGAVVAEGGEAAAAVKTDGDANPEGGDKAAGDDAAA